MIRDVKHPRHKSHQPVNVWKTRAFIQTDHSYMHPTTTDVLTCTMRGIRIYTNDVGFKSHEAQPVIAQLKI